MKSDAKPPVNASGKKTYVKPTLRTYGTVGEITQKVGPAGAVDGGKNQQGQPARTALH